MSVKHVNVVGGARRAWASGLACAGVALLMWSGAARARAVEQGTARAATGDAAARADALEGQGDLAGARALLEAALRDDPARRDHWLRLGRLAHQARDFAAAAEAYEKALALRRDWRAMYNAACAYARLGARDKALTWLEATAATGAVPPAQLDADEDLASLRADARYGALRERAARAAEPCRFQPESNRFDFWLGEWRVHPNGGTQTAGHSRIEKILSNCVVLENWTGSSGWSGKSFNVYDRRSGTWHQTWVDQSGAITHFVDGRAGEGAMSFRTEPVEEEGVRTERRLTFTALGPDRVRQHSQRSTDGGRTWEDEYDFIYERMK
jgi:hypothetical protein